MQNSITSLLGKTLTECVGSVGGEEVIFKTTDGKTFRLYHERDCCESVAVEDICGDLGDLVGSPILQAEESSSNENIGEGKLGCEADPFTWTFYRLATLKGQVVIRWYSTSNGLYSESVDFEEVAS